MAQNIICRLGKGRWNHTALLLANGTTSATKQESAAIVLRMGGWLAGIATRNGM